MLFAKDVNEGNGNLRRSILWLIDHGLLGWDPVYHARVVLTASGEQQLALLAHAPRKPLPHLPVGARTDHHHGGLPQMLGQCTGQACSALEQDIAVDTLGGKDLDEVGVLKLALPETTRLREGGADELGARQVRQGTPEQLVADPLAGLLGKVRPDVESNRASSDAVGSHRPILHGLKQRGKYQSNHCFLYFEIDRKARSVWIETSWLPNLRPVRDVLEPLGFARESRGAWRAKVELDNFVGVIRRVTRALELLLMEASDLITSDEEALETLP
jgi:hypothetical protein